MLIAHHSKDLADELGNFFSGQGFKVKTTNSYWDVEDQVRRTAYTICLIGVLLPDGNGMELCREIKKDPSNENTKVILVSSIPRSGRFSVEAKTKYKADAYFEEPIPLPELLSEVNIMCARSKKSDGASHINAARKRAAKRAAGRIREVVGGREIDDDIDLSPVEPHPRVVEEPIGGVIDIKEVPLSGRLEEVLLPEILLYLYQIRAGGTLLVKGYAEERRIMLRNGIAQFVTTNFIEDESIGQLLLRKNKITKAQLDAALKESKSSGRKIGQVLIEKKHINSSDLDRLLKQQARLKVINAFKWDEGSYEFTPQSIDEQAPARIDSAMLRLLLNGVSRHISLSKLEKRIYHNRHRVVKRNWIEGITPKDLNFSDAQWALLDLVDGETSLGDIIAKSELNFKNTFQTLYLLFLFGLISFTDAAAPMFQIEEPVLNRAINENRSAGSATEIIDINLLSFPMQGAFTEYPIGKVFFKIYQTGMSGQLLINTFEQNCSISFRNGLPVRVESTKDDLMEFCSLLEQQHLLSKEDCVKAVQEARATASRIETILLTQWQISPHHIFQCLTDFLCVQIDSLLPVKQGSYQFIQKGVEAFKDEIVVCENFPRQVLQYLIRTQNADHAIEEMDKLEHMVLDRVSGVKKNLETWFIDPREVQLIGLINGARTTQRILSRTALPAGRAMIILYVLFFLDLIKVAGPR